ncbi:hypothetical protein LIER_31707 [Lithospermum erythrorhizon]|uniref:Uncharacterized protein n=1 Tax=Lithospermum erythrorhizon TaxID=34254 RepID=A0AAV3RSH5_LITER
MQLHHLMQPKMQKEVNFKKGKFTSKNWSLNDPELKRRRRVASYKVYTVEGKSFGWFKQSCTQLHTDY